MSNFAESASVLFKRVEGGHVFQAPNPWIFGPGKRYLVNDAQKAELLAITTPRRPYLRAAVIVTAIILWAIAVSTLTWAFSGHDDPTARDAAITTTLILVPMFVALMMALRHNLRRMQPILAGAPRTEERISRSERRQAVARMLSLKMVVVVVACWSFTALMQIVMLVIRNGRHPLFSDVQSFMNVLVAIICTGLAIYYLVIAIGKMKVQKG